MSLTNDNITAITELFNVHGWSCNSTSPQHFSYNRAGNNLDIFDIRIEQNRVSVSIPMKNIQYRTSFPSYTDAVNYVMIRFRELNESN
jgi:hypothetical protein